MKITYILVIATFVVTIAACSKQESPDASNKETMTEMPAMEKSGEAKPKAMLPNEIDPGDMSGSNVEQNTSGKKVLYWHDPMVPDRHFSKSGLSPFMEMQLEPKYAE